MAAGANDVVWEEADYDDVGGWDGISHYTCDRPGLYLIGASANRAAAASASSVVVRVRVNDVTIQQTGSAPTNGAIQVQVSALLELAAGDQISENVTLHSSLSTTLSAGHTVLHIARLGPKAWT